MEDEVDTLRRNGYRAIRIAGSESDTGTLHYWHRPDNEAKNVSTQAIERALNFVLALLFEIDRKAIFEEVQS